MTVKELIEQLSNLDPDLPVHVSSDPEGNRFHELSEIEHGQYRRECPNEIQGLHPDDADEDDPWCATLWP